MLCQEKAYYTKHIKSDSQTEKKTARIKKPGRMRREVEARKKMAKLEND